MNSNTYCLIMLVTFAVCVILTIAAGFISKAPVPETQEMSRRDWVYLSVVGAFRLSLAMGIIAITYIATNVPWWVL